jgi:SP family facilitated glucose transporter-like MFS transporter 8
MSLSLVVIGLYFYLEEQEEEGNLLDGAITWMPLIALVTYNLFYNIGLGPLPRVVSTEILPQRVKGLLLTISLSLNWTLAFVVTKTFQTVRDALNPSGFFWLYGGICAAGTVFFFVFLPETRGKTFAEIEKMFVKDEIVEKGRDDKVEKEIDGNVSDLNQNEIVQHL